MLKIKGFKKINDKNIFVKDSKVLLSLYLTPMGKIDLDLHYLDDITNQEISREFISIDRTSLTFDESIIDPYEQILNAVEIFLISTYFIDEGLSAEIF